MALFSLHAWAMGRTAAVAAALIVTELRVFFGAATCVGFYQIKGVWLLLPSVFD